MSARKSYEAKAESDREALLAWFADPKVWDFNLARAFGAQNLAKRWAMAGGRENYDACARLLALAQRNEDRALVTPDGSVRQVAENIAFALLVTGHEGQIGGELVEWTGLAQRGRPLVQSS